MDLTAEAVIAELGLQPHPEEGGWFVETWRQAGGFGPEPGYATRDLHTAIYFLLTPQTVSAMHRLPGPEVFHHYLGGPVEMLLLNDDGTHEVRVLGSDLAAGQRPQIIVPGGVWQGSVLLDGPFALLGTTMAPGFAFPDYAHGDIDDLAARWPDAAAAIRARRLRR